MRLIDADELISDVLEAKQTFIGSPSEVYQHDLICDNVVRWVDYANTVEAVPAVHGYWIMHKDELFMPDSTLECSVCHADTTAYIEHYGYCPNCGARMDGGENCELQ